MSRKYIKAVLNSNISVDVTKECPISYSYSTDDFSESDMKTAVKDCLKKIKETLHVYIPKEAIDKIIDGSVLLIKSDNERKKKRSLRTAMILSMKAFVEVTRSALLKKKKMDFQCFIILMNQA